MRKRNWHVGLTAIFAGILLAGCLPEADDVSAPAPAPGETAPNSPPTISGMPNVSAVAGTLWQFQPVASDADGDALTFSATAIPSWLTLNSQTGRLSGTPAEADVGSTAAIVISVSDGEATAALPAFSITVASAQPTSPPPAEEPPPSQPPPSQPPPPANTAPQISGSPASSVQATTAYTFTPAATDAETPQSLTFSVSNKPSWASFSSVTGRLSGTPSAAQAGTYSNIVIRVSDGALSASLPAFSITVTPVPNRAPTITGTPGTTATAGTAYSFQPTGSDPDGQTLSYTIANKPAWASFSTTTGRLSGTPGDAHVGTTSGIIITVSDGTASAALAPFSITVAARANAAPTITGTPATTATVGTAYSFQPSATDPDGQTLSYTITNKPTWATFSATTGRLSGTPGDANVGTFPGIVITVSDGTLTAALPAFTLTVAARPNGTPTISGTPATTATVGSAYRFAPTASDPDGDSLSWSITGKPSNATFSTATGELTWTPTAAGTASNIVIRVTDSKGASASLPAFSITVAAAPSTGSATLSWVSPAQYTDGSPLPSGELSAFRIYKGTSASNLARIAEVDSLTTTFAVQNLTSGTHYFAVTAVAANGAESSMSSVGSKTVP